MIHETFSRGTLLWIDDRFSSTERENLPEEIWTEIFGGYSPRLFRLMRLELDLATSYEEALEAFRYYGSRNGIATYLICVIDLALPLRDGEATHIKYGIKIAKEAQKRSIPFVFLSANTSASDILEREGLGSVPYYIKDNKLGSWSLPEYLGLRILNEFRSHISWIHLDEMIGFLKSDCDVALTYHKDPEAFRFFPFFGTFRDFVERWEYKEEHFRFPRLTAIRSSPLHCHEFVQQCMLIMLFQVLTSRVEAARVFYGLTNDENFLNRISTSQIAEDPETLVILRANPQTTSANQMEELLKELTIRKNIFFLIIPDNESADCYAQVFDRFRVVTLDELPDPHEGTEPTRGELIRKSCALVFRFWDALFSASDKLPVSATYWVHPELLIHPFNWMILLEEQSVVEELSDPYEVVKELLNCIRSCPPEHSRSIAQCLDRELPVPYPHLLRVGQTTLEATLDRSSLQKRLEKVLDFWLHFSWQFPYGLEREFRSSALVQSADRRGREQATILEPWEDACFETLVGLLEEFDQISAETKIGPEQRDLDRVRRFFVCLGGNQFLRSEQNAVDWENLESMRWPHHRYPLPTAVMRRLRSAGRYLWVQPEGLDIAASLPEGRLKYRALASHAELLSAILEWATNIVDDLPSGWSWSVRHLLNLILEHRVVESWKEKHTRQETWYALLGLLRNAGPVMLVCNGLLSGEPLSGSKDSIASYLRKVKGYGTILQRIRKTADRRICGFLVPKWNVMDSRLEVAIIRRSSQFVNLLSQLEQDSLDPRFQELMDVVRVLLNQLAQISPSEKNPQAFERQMTQAIHEFINRKDLRLLSPGGWFPMQEVRDQFSQVLPIPNMPSLFATKLDHLSRFFELSELLNRITRKYWYFDGYHFLSVLNDLRVGSKDSIPPIRAEVMETVMELFVLSLEGLVAQLAWCLDLLGARQLASRLRPPHVQIVTPKDFNPPRESDLNEVLFLHREGDDYRLFSLGIPGKNYVEKLCFHEVDEVRTLNLESA